MTFRSDDQLQIMTVKLGSQELHEGILTYVDGDKTYIPLSEFFESINLPIDVMYEDAYAEGWFREESNLFVLDYQKKLLSIGGKQIDVEWADVEWHEFDIYVESNLLKAWLDLDFSILINELIVLIDKDQWLPLEAALKRHSTWKRLSKQVPIIHADDTMILDNPGRVIGWPSFDNNLRVGYQNSRGRVSQQLQYDVIGAADFLWLKANFSANVAYASGRELTHFSRLYLENDFDADKGELRFQGGDLSGPAVPLVVSQQDGVGFVFSNFSEQQTASFNAIELQGEALNGWDVEVYRNNQIIAFQTVDESNRYEFTNLPVQTGRNVLRLVFYGPEGQRREKIEEYAIGENAITPGSVQWLFSSQISNRRLLPGQLDFVLNQNDDERLINDLGVTAGARFGLSNALVLNTSLSKVAVDEASAPAYFANVGVNGAIQSLVYSFDLNGAENGGFAARATAQILDDRQNWQAEYAYFHNYQSPTQPLGLGGELLQHRLLVNWNGRLGEASPIGFNTQHLHFDSGRDRLRTEARYSHKFPSFNWSTAVNYTLDDNELDSLGGGALLSVRREGFGVNGQISYSVKPELLAQSAAVSTNWRINDDMNFRFSLNKALNSQQNDNLRANLSNKFKDWTLGISASHNLSGDYTFSVNVFSSANRTGLGWSFDAASKVNAASASVRVFLDNNGNDQFDDGDEPIPDVRFRLSGGRGKMVTDENGYLQASNMPANQIVDIRLQEGSLEDPYWLPVIPGYKVKLRSGQYRHFDFPVVQSSEVDGTVWILGSNEPKPAANVVVELVGEDGTVVKSERSSYDGFYLMDKVRPGTYKLRISPEQLQRLNLQVDAEFDLLLEGNGDIKTGLDFELTEINL